MRILCGKFSARQGELLAAITQMNRGAILNTLDLIEQFPDWLRANSLRLTDPQLRLVCQSTRTRKRERTGQGTGHAVPTNDAVEVTGEE